MKSRLTKSLYKQTPLKTGDSIYPLKSKYLYMKKILVFVLLMASMFGWGQTDEARTINNANFPVALYSGIPDINIPLFTLETINKNFSVDVRLENNLYASASKEFSTRGIGDGWSLNILGSITLKPGKNGHSLPASYDETQYSKLMASNEDKEGHTVYSYSTFGLNGRFVIVKNGSHFSPKIIEQNDYAEIDMDYTATNNEFRLKSFIITDKRGFSYLFASSSTVKITENYSSTYNQHRTFFLSEVRDKHGNVLLDYHYRGDDDPDGSVHSDVNGYSLSSIDVVGMGIITLSEPKAVKRTLEYKDLRSDRKEKIEFMFTSMGPYTKLLVSEVRFYSNNDNDTKSYHISYKRTANSGTRNHYGFPHSACASWAFTREHVRYDNGTVEKIINPQGGVTFYEFELNTVGRSIPEDFGHVDPESPVYKDFLRNIAYSIPENFTFEELPVSYNSTYGGYVVDPSNAYQGYDKGIFIDYTIAPVEILPPSPPAFPDGKYYTPKLTYDIYTTTPLLNVNNPLPAPVCAPGLYIEITSVLHKLLLKIETQYAGYYNIKAYYKKRKSDNELVFHTYGIGPRIKRIKSFTENTTSINSFEKVVSEQVFHYERFGKPRTSSGYLPSASQSLDSYSDLNLYRNVVVETTGVGSVYYEFDDINTGAPFNPARTNKVKFLKSLNKYDQQNRLVESTDFERVFHEPVVQLNNEEIKIQPIITYEKTITESFENGASSGLRAITESTFDTLTRHLTHRKITDSGTGDTFEEAYTYQKLGNAFYRTGVEKKKNNQALNRSVYAYQQYENTQVYNLKAVSTAKENRPLQVEREITRYDNYGNITEYKTKDGMVVSQIWGYNNAKVVAELKNVPYANINSSTIIQIKLYSIVGPTYNETTLSNVLNGLRATHDNGFVTTYTYKPLVGITSVTDANGRKETYQYDSFNRLWRVLNHEGLIVKEYEYNIKN